MQSWGFKDIYTGSILLYSMAWKPQIDICTVINMIIECISDMGYQSFNKCNS